MVRSAFQRLREGIMKIGAIEKHCASETGWPLRYAKDAVHDIRSRVTPGAQGATRKTRARRIAILFRGSWRRRRAGRPADSLSIVREQPSSGRILCTVRQ